MAVHKEVSFLAFLLVLGILLLHVDAKACSEENAENRICTNCCAGRKGCNYYSADGTFICEGESDPNNPKPCTLNCDPRIFYSKCPRSEGNAENRICTNCCAGRKGCNYYSADGTFICEGESDPNNPKPCTLNCDPRIFYSKCPRSEGNAENRICTNCCAGRKGCNYYSSDGTFICEGESDPNNPKPCTLNCDPRIFYSKCPRSEASAEQPICTNCCAGLKGCNYYNADGTFICEGQSDPNNPKICDKNCDPKIFYKKCRRSEASAEEPICTNCCAGRKGCNYYSADGTFICEGESDPNNPKACPRNCDTRIFYSKCLYEEPKSISTA